MHPDVEKDLTYTLLTELLAHQFAYPVRWIETQNAILGDVQAEQVVEVGPSNTLTNMMKRTWDQKFAAKDESQTIRRRFLGPQDGLAEIYYQTGAPVETKTDEAPTRPSRPISAGPQVSQEASAQISSEDLAPSLQPQPTKHPTQLGPSGVLAAVLQDIPVPTPTIVKSIVAAKLKRSPDDVKLDKSINKLVAGRSTLSNEIVGDLHAEFPGRVPDRAEDESLIDLSQTLNVGHDGRLGKSTASLVARLVSSKLPGDYGQTKIRQILEDKWGLGPMRQDAVLLVAVTKQPAARITGADAAELFLTEVAATYFQQEKLPLPSRSGNGSSNPGPAIVDAKSLRFVQEQNISLIKNIVDVLSDHLEGTGTQHQESPATSPQRQAKDNPSSADLLNLWVTEHGEDYADGITPKFDVKKQRVYESYWNWCSQDIALFFALCRNPEPEHAELIDRLSTSIVNRACDRAIAQIKYLQSQAEAQGPESNQLTQTIRFLYEACLASKDRSPVFVDRCLDMAPLTTVDENGKIVTSEIARSKGHLKATKPTAVTEVSDVTFPIGKFHGGAIASSHELSIAYARDLEIAKNSGFGFTGRNVLLTGAGKNSIGIHILRNLLSGGARVTVTTSSYSMETTRMYQSVYAEHGAKGSVLRVVPFNQGSQQDVGNLVQWITDDGGWDLDFIIPFAALSENGRDLENLDSRTEIAHRLMLTNLLRMLGAVARSKRARGILTRPATVLLPLSPNHGLMGNDGLYSESKRSLEALFAKWTSESWAEYLSLLGVIIGWTRGTGLMDDNDIVAHAVENMGLKTFSAPEMAAKISTLLGGSMNAECQLVPLVADLGGGMRNLRGLKEKVTGARRLLREYASMQQAVREERLRDAAIVSGRSARTTQTATVQTVSTRANIKLPFPTLPDYERDIAPIAMTLQGMVDLSRVVVITGFSEIGPHGNSRTRWEMEGDGRLSLGGVIEMAWMMGLIKHHSGVTKDGSQYSGWVDATTMSPIDEADIHTKYMSRIREHTGIREVEPDICDGNYDPNNKESVQEIVLQRDLPPFEATPEIAEGLQRKHGNKALVTRETSGGYLVQLKTGAAIMVARSSRFNRTVAGQIPTGWSPKRYGISDDIIEQVDPVTLFSLVCTVEAFLCSGITDPYEWYQYIHVSELGTCIGSSMGGLSSLRKMHRERYLDKQVKSDILQETFVNTIGAWINMLLTSSAGPIRTPVGACATSLESLDTGYDLIVAKKAKVVLVGGVEDFVEDVSYEFGNMKATCDTDAEYAAGRSAAEMSRPTTSSRSGFVEAQGCGVQVLTSAELALEMGLPIYGIVAYTNMSADKAGRSVPAPGKGVLTNAREPSNAKASPQDKDAAPWPLLDLGRRRRMLSQRRRQIAEFVEESLEQLKEEMDVLKRSDMCLEEEEDLERCRRQRIAVIHEEARRQEADAAFNLGNQFWKGGEKERISPIRGCLAVWGLGIDDISVASLHGTSTVKNDLNEPLVVQAQMRHLGRQDGNLLPCVCQKWLTGHSKGAAGV
ncbi:Uncharacterized protein TPAR_07356 [Tolypocladium paradoxum]|uniref:beta-ketoacyl-[acyl-carrier-protein] synthase I n=1 Tax=Tolypocladium paradoxum TaxID=94208 RepID=A0A2S4KQJ7_9HYPO|nr:Uncharacterized protein TPAR_07356 [Tolypocladium paradoxum]